MHCAFFMESVFQVLDLAFVASLQESDQKVSLMEDHFGSLAGLLVFFHCRNIDVVYLVQKGSWECHLFQTGQELFFSETETVSLGESTELLVDDQTHWKVLEVEFSLITKYLVNDIGIESHLN